MSIETELCQQAEVFDISDRELTKIISGIPKELLEESHNLGFIMFTPDALIQDAATEILRKYGLFVLQYRLISMAEKDAEKVYENELFHGIIYAWWIKRKIFTLGSTFVALVTWDATLHNEASLSKYLHKIKGASDPMLCNPDTIRYDYRVSSKAFGFMHSSDDELSVIKEAQAFFTKKDLSMALEQIKDGREKGKLSCCDEKELAACTSKLKKEIITLSYYQVLYNVKKLLLLKWTSFHKENQAVGAAAGELFGLYESALEITDQRLAFRAERDQINELLLLELNILKPFLKPEYTLKELAFKWIDFSEVRTKLKLTRILKLMVQLTDFKQFNLLETEFLLEELKQLEIHMDEFDQLLLGASLFFYKS
jgi:nucleoside diphosphate kinase